MTVELAGAVATNQCQWIASWEDKNVATQFGETDDTTPVTVVPAPSAQSSGTRKLSSFSLYNSDTAAVAVTVTYADSTGPSTHVLQSITLQAGESLIYEQNSGWSGLDTQGNTKVASNTVQVSTALSTALVASSQASNATASNAAQSTSISTLTTNLAAVSSAASLGVNGSSLASSAHTALGNESTISSAVSRLKASFGW